MVFITGGDALAANRPSRPVRPGGKISPALVPPRCFRAAARCSASGFQRAEILRRDGGGEATWHTAVPTMHQAPLTRAAQNKAVIARHPLRFVRSSSSSLPPQVIGELEAAFPCAGDRGLRHDRGSHQMAANPLQGSRKPGSVGRRRRAGDRDHGRGRRSACPLGGSARSSFAARASPSGYENHAKANAEAFVNGWFRTGDQGVIDVEGYVTLTGRLKEIISRGGEKISPREVDEALMDHPAVLQVVTFGVPHEMLGEDVAAAVVLREGASASEAELRAFLSERIAAFKTPRKILFLAEIPKGATGKLQRIGLAQKLGLA